MVSRLVFDIVGIETGRPPGAEHGDSRWIFLCRMIHQDAMGELTFRMPLKKQKYRVSKDAAKARLYHTPEAGISKIERADLLVNQRLSQDIRQEIPYTKDGRPFISHRNNGCSKYEGALADVSVITSQTCRLGSRTHGTRFGSCWALTRS